MPPMRNILLQLLAYSILSAQPLAADPSQPPLAPGKPAGVRPAQARDMIPIYGGVILFGALLAVTIGVTGGPTYAVSSTASGSPQVATP